LIIVQAAGLLMGREIRLVLAGGDDVGVLQHRLCVALQQILNGVGLRTRIGVVHGPRRIVGIHGTGLGAECQRQRQTRETASKFRQAQFRRTGSRTCDKARRRMQAHADHGRNLSSLHGQRSGMTADYS
jgi:hypothetical protein